MSNEFSSWLEQTQVQLGIDFEHAIASRLPSFPSQLHDAILYVCRNKGKMIRPLLTIASGRALGTPYSAVVPIALAIEAIHVYSLAHDDLPAMDDDDLRRGKPTCHKIYNDATAILVGDALQALAFQIIGESEQPADIRIQQVLALAKAAGPSGMVGGQMLDITATGQQSTPTLESLDQLHNLKTGAMIEAAVLMPHISLQQDHPALFNKLAGFAQKIGLAFQIQDDILDMTQTTEALGKPAGSDEGLDKLTYPALLGLEQSKQRLDSLYQQAIDLIKDIPGNFLYLEALARMIIHRNK